MCNSSLYFDGSRGGKLLLATIVIVTIMSWPRPVQAENKSEAFLVRTRIADLPELSGIGEIKFGDLHPSPGPELGFAGSGAVVLAMGGQVVARVPQGAYNFFSADVDNNGQMGFITRSIRWVTGRGHLAGFKLLDDTGSERWTYHPIDAGRDIDYTGTSGVGTPLGGNRNFVLSASAVTGDLDADGASDIVIWGAAPVGMQRVDATGQMVWKISDDRPNPKQKIQLREVDGRPGDEIVHAHGKKKVRVRNATGEVIRDIELSRAPGSWTMVTWPPGEQKSSLLVPNQRNNKVELFGQDSTPFITLNAPIPSDPSDVKATPVKFVEEADPYLAVVMSFEKICGLFVFDSGGNLVFEDSPKGCGAIAAIPSGPGVERLLIASGSRVWHYKPAES